MIIAIDGPAGSGKTTAAKLLARTLGILYLDTGATYRALTYAALESGVAVSDEAALAALAEKLPLSFRSGRVYLGPDDITDAIRTPRIDKNISPIVAHPKVREVMVAFQRKLAQGGDYVVEGRDITTVVFPRAEWKFYLDADPRVRAQRRLRELTDKGIRIDWHEVKSDLEKRDRADTERSVGSLKKSDDATCIDTTDLTIEDTVQKIAAIVKAHTA